MLCRFSDVSCYQVRAIIGQTYMLNETEELWEKDLPEEVEGRQTLGIMVVSRIRSSEMSAVGSIAVLTVIQLSILTLVGKVDVVCIIEILYMVLAEIYCNLSTDDCKIK